MKRKETTAKQHAEIDYNVWIWKRGELFLTILSGIGITCTIDWLFYRSLILLPFLTPFIYFWVRLVKKEKINKRKEKLSADFQTALHSLAMSLKAGYSVENAFPQTARDLRMLIGDDAPMTKEFQWMCSRISLKHAPEELLMNFAARSGVEDIENFAEVFTCARKMGGDLAGVLQNTADVIESKIDTEKSIASTLASKKFEQRIMAVMPCGIILYMRLGSPGYLDPLYGSLPGALIMTICLIVYLAAIAWCEHIVHIEV